MNASYGTVWNLSGLWSGPDDPLLAREMADCLDLAKDFTRSNMSGLPAMSGSPCLSGQSRGVFPEIVRAYEEILAREERVEAFAELWGALRTKDGATEGLRRRVGIFQRSVRLRLRPFELAWAELDNAQARFQLETLGDHPAQHNLEKARRFRPHLLDPDREALLTNILSPIRSAWMAQWGDLIGTIECSHSNQAAPLGKLLVLLSHPSRTVRAASEAKLGRALEHSRSLFARVLEGSVLAKNQEDQARNHRHWLQARTLNEETTTKAVDHLMEGIRCGFPLVRRYFRLKAKLLGQDVLAGHDRLAPPLPGFGRAMSWPDVQSLALAGLARLTPSLADMALVFFKEGRIDAAPRPGKVPGAFCRSTGDGSAPFILLNASGRARDTAVLVHELGHGLHHLLSDGLGPLGARAPMALGEALAVCGELALFEERLARARSGKARLVLLCHRLEDDITTIFRQAALHGFEDDLHRSRDQGTGGPDGLDALWLKSQEELYQGAVSGHLPTGWAVIPHFFLVPGYVHVYVRAGSLAVALWERREAMGPNFAPAFEALCAAGGSRPLTTLLAPFGIDPDDPGLAESVLKRFQTTLEQAERLAKRL